MLVLIRIPVSLDYVSIQFLSLHLINTLINGLDRLLNVHFYLFRRAFDRRDHLFDLTDRRLYYFALTFAQLSSQYIQGFPQFVHRFVVSSFKFEYLLYQLWQIRELIPVFIIY